MKANSVRMCGIGLPSSTKFDGHRMLKYNDKELIVKKFSQSVKLFSHELQQSRDDEN